MNGQNDEYILSEEEAIKEQLEELKSRVTQLHNDIPCLKQCSRLSDLLQKLKRRAGYQLPFEANYTRTLVHLLCSKNWEIAWMKER